MVGAWQFKDMMITVCSDLWMENSLVYTKFCVVLRKSRVKGRQDFYLGHDGGDLIPTHSKIGQGMGIHFEILVNGYGNNALIPVYPENDTFNSYLNREVKSAETNNVNDAEHCFAKDSRQSGNEYGRAVRS